MDIKGTQLTEEEKRKKIKSELYQNFFVEAGAGAGKTTLIVERIVNQIKAGIEPERLVVITFTNKAAQELKERIVKKVHGELENCEEETEYYQNLKTAKENIGRMQISTIHSFCHRILTEQAFPAKLPLDVKLLENDENRSEKERFFDSQFAQLDKENYQKLKDNYQGNFKEAMLSVFMDICELPEDTEIMYHKELFDNTIDYYETEAERLYQAFSKDIVDTLATHTGSAIQGINEVKLQSAFKKYFEQKPLEAAKTIKSGMNIFVSQGGANNLKNTAGAWQVSNQIWNNNPSKALIALGNEYKGYQHALIIEAAVQIRNQYWKERETGVSAISNDALIQRACRLVCENEEAWEYFSEKYDCIYVDEFQDTDHIQTKMILQLCRKAFDEKTLREGSLFVVGDAKQSIYRFRGADLHTYENTKTFAQNEENFTVVNLQDNYRSNEKIVQWINQEFQQKIGTGYQPMTTAVGKRGAAEQNAKPCLEGVYYVESLNQATKIKNGKSQKIKEMSEEICQVCTLIENLVGTYTIWDKDLENYRDIKYADFLILCDKKNHMEEYVSAFQNRGIPVNLSGKADISKDSVLIRFARLYRYLTYPYRDRRAKEAAMQEVLRTLIGEERIFDAYEQTGELQKSIQEKKAEERLKNLRTQTEKLSGSALAIFLLHHLEYILDWDREISENELRMEQKRLYQMVEQVLSQNPDSPQVLEQAFFAYIEETVEKELVLSYQEDAVRFMNVHKAKGLEGHIVILVKRTWMKSYEMAFQREKDGDNQKNNQEFAYEYYPVCKTGKDTTSVGYQMDSAIWDQAKAEEREEEIRLEYVAATRAMEALIVMSPLTESKCFFQGYGDAPGNVKAQDITKVNKDILSVEDSNTKQEDFQEYDKTMWNHEFTEEQKKQEYLDICPSALEDKTVEMDKKDRSVEDRPDGNVFGTVMHRAYERLIQYWKKAEGTPIEKMGEKIVPSVTQAIMEYMDEIKNEEKGELEENIERYRTFLEQKLKKYINDEDIKELMEHSEEIYTELPFSIWTSKEQDPELFETMRPYLEKKNMMPKDHQPVWIHGIADFVCRRDDGMVWVIDYKSDKKGKEDDIKFAKCLWARYGGQLSLYECVMKKLFPNTKAKAWVYHLYDKRKQ